VAASQTFAIVGAGLAGAKAAEALRREGFEGRVVLIGEEAARPYERPPLSKAYLRGEAGFDRVAVHKERFYSDHDIELLTSSPVRSLDLRERRLELEGASSVRYDRLLLATGASPRRLALEGAGLAGVHYLRDIGQADALGRAIRSAGRVAVIGAGWIGCEVAASAREMGAEVTLIEMASVPLESVLGPEVGAVYRDLHADQGVDLRMGATVKALRGGAAVEAVELGGGEVVPADVVVVGVGVAPRTELLAGEGAAGLAVEDGVVVDQGLATTVPGVYAAGDVASALHPLYRSRIRLEHWSAALNQGRDVARAMLGQHLSYERIPYFYSDQYDLSMEYTGWAPRWARVVFRGDVAGRQFVAFWLDDADRVLAGMNVNVWEVTEAIEAMIRSGRPVDVERLTDPDTDLATLAGSSA